jgi:hypothetical protein
MKSNAGTGKGNEKRKRARRCLKGRERVPRDRRVRERNEMEEEFKNRSPRDGCRGKRHPPL